MHTLAGETHDPTVRNLSSSPTLASTPAATSETFWPTHPRPDGVGQYCDIPLRTTSHPTRDKRKRQLPLLPHSHDTSSGAPDQLMVTTR